MLHLLSKIMWIAYSQKVNDFEIRRKIGEVLLPVRKWNVEMVPAFLVLKGKIRSMQRRRLPASVATLPWAVIPWMPLYRQHRGAWRQLSFAGGKDSKTRPPEGMFLFLTGKRMSYVDWNMSLHLLFTSFIKQSWIPKSLIISEGLKTGKGISLERPI